MRKDSRRDGVAVILAGRPNTGKTSLFNALTGSRQRVANFAGTTVEAATGTARCGAGVVDLPGTASILADTLDEAAALEDLDRRAALGGALCVLCVAEASNIATDAALAVSLKELGYPVTLVANMIDEAVLNGLRIDREELEARLGLPVVLASARTGQGVAEIERRIEGSPKLSSPPEPLGRIPRQRLRAVHRAALAKAREAARASVRRESAGDELLPTLSRSIAIDRVLFHPVAGPVILAAVLFCSFQALFTWAEPAMNAISNSLAWASETLRPLLPWPGLAGLLCDGVLPGIAAVAQFVPQIALLFLFLGTLEQSGYLPRAAATLDRALRPFGLDGRAVIPLLSSFACAIPGIMATRTIPSARKRLAAITLSPLMTCSARIPVYTLIIGAFVPAKARFMGLSVQGLAMTALYAFGVAVALLVALVLGRTVLRDERAPSLSLLPPYRLPQAGGLARYVLHRCSSFLLRAGQVIFCVSLALWFLSSFPRPNQGAADRAITRGSAASEAVGAAASVGIESTYLGRLGKAVEPVFRPLGYDWRLSVALIASLAAREVFVGTLGTVFALDGKAAEGLTLNEALRKAQGPDGAPLYGAATAVSLLIFFAIALQCLSTVAAVRRETGGWKWPTLQFAAFFALAYSLSWLGFHIIKAWSGA